MKIKEITIDVRRSLRHEPYITSHVECSLVAEGPGDLRKSFEEIHQDVLVIIEEMVEKEKEDYEKTKRVKVRPSASRQPRIEAPF